MLKNKDNKSFMSLSCQRRLASSINKLIITLLITSASLTLTACDKHWQSKKQLVDSILNEMIYVPGGTFDFQDSANAKVNLDGYYMTKYAITEYQYKSYKNLIGLPPNRSYGDKTVKYFNGKYPAYLDLDKAIAFCGWLGQQTHLPMALPTEEQWEYAAKSEGKDILFSTNDNKLEPGKNFPTEKDTHQARMPVNQYPPNPEGFYMMNANGFELTSSCWNDYNYVTGVMHNPKSDIAKCIKDKQDVVVRGSTLMDIQTYLSGEKDYLSALSLYNRVNIPPNPGGNFRCVINSNQKPLPIV